METGSKSHPIVQLFGALQAEGLCKSKQAAGRDKDKLHIPTGTQPGTTLRIKGKGLPKRAGISRGDQRVEVTIEVPTQLTQRQRELLEELAKELKEEVLPQRKGFMDKLRDLFG